MKFEQSDRDFRNFRYYLFALVLVNEEGDVTFKCRTESQARYTHVSEAASRFWDRLELRLLLPPKKG